MLTSIEEKYTREELRLLRVDAYAFPFKHLPEKIRNKYKKYADGRMFVFKNYPATKLLPLKQYALILVSKIHVYSEEIGIDPQVHLYITEFAQDPQKIKKRFPGWKVLRGRIKRGKIEVEIEWIMRIPVYKKNTVAFISSPRDANKLYLLVGKYRHPKKNPITSITDIDTQPLFRNDTELLRSLISSSSLRLPSSL